MSEVSNKNQENKELFYADIDAPIVVLSALKHFEALSSKNAKSMPIICQGHPLKEQEPY